MSASGMNPVGERFGVRHAQSRELCSLTRVGAHRLLGAEQAAQRLGSALSREEASLDPNSWAFSYQVRAKSMLATCLRMPNCAKAAGS